MNWCTVSAAGVCFLLWSVTFAFLVSIVSFELELASAPTPVAIGTTIIRKPDTDRVVHVDVTQTITKESVICTKPLTISNSLCCWLYCLSCRSIKCLNSIGNRFHRHLGSVSVSYRFSRCYISKQIVYLGHGDKFERISSNFKFELTKFEFSKNRNKFESLFSNFEQTAVSIKRAFDISPFHLVPRGPLGTLMFPSC